MKIIWLFLHSIAKVMIYNFEWCIFMATPRWLSTTINLSSLDENYEKARPCLRYNRSKTSFSFKSNFLSKRNGSLKKYSTRTELSFGESWKMDLQLFPKKMFSQWLWRYQSALCYLDRTVKELVREYVAECMLTTYRECCKRFSQVPNAPFTAQN